MTKTKWTKVYEAIKGIKTPQWLQVILKEIQVIVVQVAIGVGKEVIANLKKKIMDVADTDMSPEEKIDEVFDWCKKQLAFVEIKDRYLNMLIEIIYNYLREKRAIKGTPE